MRILPGLNYSSKLSIDDLETDARLTEEAILDRFRLSMGDKALTELHFGVVDLINPRTVLPGDSRPLVVSANLVNVLNIDITAGYAVTKSGAIIAVEAASDIVLARTNVGDVLVVYAENELIDAGPSRLTRYLTAQKTQRLINPNNVKSSLLNDYNNPSLFPEARKNNIVILAVISVVSTTTVSLNIDHTNVVYSFCRPWFSMVDVEHRSFLGTGTATPTNPHATSPNDLTSGGLTVFEQDHVTGFVLSKDDDVNGAPGVLCKETITGVLTDSSGGITGASRFGGAGAKYFLLAKYPAEIRAAYWTTHKGRDVAIDHILGTRIVVLAADEVIPTLPEGVVIEYTDAAAGRPPAAILSNSITFEQPTDSRELIITGGRALDAITNPIAGFESSGPIPRNFTVYAKGDGSLLKIPDQIRPPLILDTIGTTLTSINFSAFGPCYILVGLADAATVSTMQISVRLTGKDVNGVIITEDLIFNSTNWVSVSVPNEPNVNQALKSTKVYSQLIEFQVLNRQDDGPASKVILYAEYETNITPALSRLAKLATIKWDGTTLTSLMDARKILTAGVEPQNRFWAAASFDGTGGTQKVHVLSEDFKKPRFHKITTGSSAATSATFSISVNDYTQIVSGDSITVNSKTLFAITAGVPNRALGQFLAKTSANATRDELISTINYGAFASGLTATVDTSANGKLICIQNTSGARGNVDVTTSIANPGSIGVSPQVLGGIDEFRESFIPKHQENVNSAIPSISVYEVESIRDRYLSVAIPIGGRNRITVVLHGMKLPNTGAQLRMRIASNSSSEWGVWTYIPLVGSVGSITSTTPISKVQLEVFGLAQGYSLFEGDI